MAKNNQKTDTESGIRSKRDIDNLPVKALTDDEITKLFFNRFKANCLVLMFQDDKGKYYCLGRGKRTKKARIFWERISNRFQYLFGTPENWKEL